MDLRLDADPNGSPRMAGHRRGLPMGHRQRLRQDAAGDVRAVALLPIHDGPHRNDPRQGGHAHRSSLRRGAGAGRRVQGPGGGPEGAVPVHSGHRVGGVGPPPPVRAQPQTAPPCRDAQPLHRPHQHPAGGDPSPPPPRSRQQPPPRRAHGHHQRHLRRHAQHRLISPSHPVASVSHFARFSYFRVLTPYYRVNPNLGLGTCSVALL
mmetsp:Transcript_11459/g.20728  ORF Transcript_11459/g.20728 Transcript_11459/m.20728 type:complete len:207 (-) Transcript_11459:57-677(-)